LLVFGEKKASMTNASSDGRLRNFKTARLRNRINGRSLLRDQNQKGGGLLAGREKNDARGIALLT